MPGNQPEYFVGRPSYSMKSWLLIDARDENPLLSKLQVAAFQPEVRSDTQKVTKYLTKLFKRQKWSST
jgi:hypothetical protein